MSKRLVAMEAARRALEASSGDLVAEMSTEELLAAVGSLQHAVTALLEVVEEQPLSERRAAQADEEFRNLARAARMEVHAARGALQRLDAFEQALTRLLWPDDDEEAGR